MKMSLNRTLHRHLIMVVFTAVSLTVAGCSSAAAAAIPFLASETPTPTFTPTNTPTETPTPTFTPTFTPTITDTPTITPTPSITPTPTFSFPEAEVRMQANCRYGPGTAYLYSAGLYPGDHVEIHNRDSRANWLWVLNEDVGRHCWVAASVLDIRGDVFTVTEYYHPLPYSTLYGPPQNVKASLSGDEATVTWDLVWMTDDDRRGYLLEVQACDNGVLFGYAVHTEATSFTFKVDDGCAVPSNVKLYAVEKHGYTDPVRINIPN